MDDGYSINDEEIEGGDMPGQRSAGGWNQRSCQEELFWEQVEDALRHWNVKRMKHTRDNRRGFCLMMTSATTNATLTSIIDIGT